MTRRVPTRVGRPGRGDARPRHALAPALAAVLATALLVATGAPRPASGQTPHHASAGCPVSPLPSPNAVWTPPLGRPVTLRLSARTLPEALEQVAVAAGVRLSYSGDHLPVPALLCASLDVDFAGVPLGQALHQLLAGSLDPVAAGAELVVLAPVRASRGAAGVAGGRLEELPHFTLDPVVVKIDPREVEQRSSPVAVQVISGAELRRQGATSWVSALNGAVPGLWSWQPSSGGVTSSFGSIRGASSFGLQAPKVYLDGIELANPLVAARLSPETIERIEVIRGPEGSALYGAGAIAGVTKIVTRHDRGGEGASRVRVRSSFGLAGSDYATGSALAQDHSIGVTLGSQRRSAVLSLSAQEAPEVVPGSTSRYLGLDGSLRWLGETTLVSATLRLSDERSALSASPLLASAMPGTPARLQSEELGLARYTAGLSATFQPEGRWTHTLVAGLDGYAFDGLENDPTTIPTLADSALFAAGAGATRGTLRLNSSRTVQWAPRVESHLTIGIEQSVLLRRAAKEDPAGDLLASAPGLDPKAPPLPGRIWDTGLSARLTTSVFERLFLTGGLRVERNVGGALTTRVAALPTLGASLVVGDVGPVAVKLRTAYGRAIRWPDLPSVLTPRTLGQNRGTSDPRGIGLVSLALGPEEQSGIETGVDLSLGSLEVSLTRFDQTSTGFVTAGSLDGGEIEGGAPWPTGGWLHHPARAIGRIDNRGWELQGSLQQGALSLAGTLSLVDSRVRSLGDSYEGDLLPGDRMLGVPARTVGLNATWSAPAWSTSLGVSRAFDWIGYDRVALAEALSASAEGIPSSGLRGYWRAYDGFTHLRLGASRALGQGVTLLFSVENLLDRQVGEPDNATVVPGRTVTVGVSAGLPWFD